MDRNPFCTGSWNTYLLYEYFTVGNRGNKWFASVSGNTNSTSSMQNRYSVLNNTIGYHIERLPYCPLVTTVWSRPILVTALSNITLRYVNSVAFNRWRTSPWHYNDFVMGVMASQITCIPMVCSTVCSAADKRKYQSSASLAFDQWIPLTKSVTRKMFPFDYVIMVY